MPSLRPVSAMLVASQSAEFDQDIGGRVRATRRLAPHDAGKRIHRLLVRDHAHGLIELVAFAIQRDQTLVRSRASDREIALDLGGIEYVEWPSAVIGDEIGDVDEHVDRTKPDGGETTRQPRRRGAVLHAAHEP